MCQLAVTYLTFLHWICYNISPLDPLPDAAVTYLNNIYPQDPLPDVLGNMTAHLLLNLSVILTEVVLRIVSLLMNGITWKINFHVKA